MKKDILDILDIKKNDIISITGSAGKTSLMFYLAKRLRDKGKVLVTTSTKIKVPENDEYDFLYTSKKDYKRPINNKLVVIGKLIKDKNKLKSIDKDILLEKIKDFDFTLIEADGSRNLPLKYWKDYEPVIYKETSKAIGIFPIKVLGKKPSNDFIYNYEYYIKNIGKDIISKEIILKLIKSKPGIFKGFEGKKIIYINQVESNEEKEKAYDLAKYLKDNLDQVMVFYGSILKEEYYEN
ncbi:selenium cofactor biosynthesis protein YqeC [Anaerococcus porci]|uniref:selenium cofactor biosynthesis protein YqeC n=1 Tax=Anaerococcus porci TaxID=2652269 RepID=UPI002A75F4D1|nr:selenium cofactor biosynthesis protein YqeC [Anaerococcus porci]MDY3005713.1 selenium cofactor biosynthesis protein YqeC [Anaerococcus porci]